MVSTLRDVHADWITPPPKTHPNKEVVTAEVALVAAEVVLVATEAAEAASEADSVVAKDPLLLDPVPTLRSSRVLRRLLTKCIHAFMRCHSANKQEQGTKKRDHYSVHRFVQYRIGEGCLLLYNAYHLRFQIGVTKRLQSMGVWQVTVDAACNARKATINVD